MIKWHKQQEVEILDNMFEDFPDADRIIRKLVRNRWKLHELFTSMVLKDQLDKALENKKGVK